MLTALSHSKHRAPQEQHRVITAAAKQMVDCRSHRSFGSARSVGTMEGNLPWAASCSAARSGLLGTWVTCLSDLQSNRFGMPFSGPTNTVCCCGHDPLSCRGFGPKVCQCVRSHLQAVWSGHWLVGMNAETPMRLKFCKGEAASSQRRQYSVVVPQSLVVLYLLGLLLRQPTPAS